MKLDKPVYRVDTKGFQVSIFAVGVRKKRHERKGEWNMLSVIIPVYNEERTILPIVTAVERVPIPKEIIIVNDGSTDHTPEILRQMAHKRNLKVLQNGRNLGKGTAIRRGLEVVSGEFVIIQDADLENDPLDYLPITRLLQEGATKVVYGSRFLSGKNNVALFWIADVWLQMAEHWIF
jgi:glycosyltransferase involved in cell wall biosynthesis